MWLYSNYCQIYYNNAEVNLQSGMKNRLTDMVYKWIINR